MGVHQRWRNQHGYGSNQYHSTPHHYRVLMRKKVWPTESAARDQALLMDLKHGTPFDAYPCRWGENWREGETAPLHWHVGHVSRKQQLTT